MSIENDARAVIVSLLRGQVCEHGVFSTSAYNEVVKDHCWLARIWDNGTLHIPPSHTAPRDAKTAVFYSVLFQLCGLERDAEIPFETDYYCRLLGPLGLAAIHASLTTTTVGD